MQQELRKAGVEKNNELVDLISCKQSFILLKNKDNLSSRQYSYLKY